MIQKKIEDSFKKMTEHNIILIQIKINSAVKVLMAAIAHLYCLLSLTIKTLMFSFFIKLYKTVDYIKVSSKSIFQKSQKSFNR